MQLSVNASLIDHLQKATGLRFKLESEFAQPISGGDINLAYQLTDKEDRHWFLKINKASCGDMLATEAAGLKELAAAGAIRTPQCIGCGVHEQTAWILLEWLELNSSGTADAALGQSLAALHRVTNTSFGWQFDNYIGTSPQSNTVSPVWADFYGEQRLRPQLLLAEASGAGTTLLDCGYALIDSLQDRFAGRTIVPSLLHGDLWSGNKGFLADGSPVIFDPAVYFGDREADLAMTHLFGGFDADFYTAYEQEWPLDDGAEARRDLYNIYHILNHYNLFGGDYENRAEKMLQGLLAT